MNAEHVARVSSREKVWTAGRVVYLIFNLLFYPGLLLLLAGNWSWMEGWIFSVWFVTTVLGTTIYLDRHDPELLRERFKRPGTGGQKSWDKLFMLLLLVVFLGWYVVMPLDAKRFGWSAGFPAGLKIVGGIALLPAAYLMFRSLAENSYASAMVRIQSERRQQVISTGVYGVVRHPMYSGAMLYFLGTSLLLGSRYGFLIALGMCLMFVVRLLGEEKVLMAELDGYADYRHRVRYRLIPYLW